MASLTDSGERIIANTHQGVEYSNREDDQFSYSYQKQLEPDLDLNSFYKLQESAQIIRNHFKNTTTPIKIALQFPDELLLDASLVATQLDNLLNQDSHLYHTYVLGDTTYSNCCV